LIIPSFWENVPTENNVPSLKKELKPLKGISKEQKENSL